MHASFGVEGASSAAGQHAPRRALLETLLRSVVRASDRALLIAELGAGDDSAAVLRAVQSARPLACIEPLELASALPVDAVDGDGVPSASALDRFALYVDDGGGDASAGRRECGSPMDSSDRDGASAAGDALASLELWLQREQARAASRLADVRGDGAKRRAADAVAPGGWRFDELMIDADVPSKAARLVKSEAAFVRRASKWLRVSR